MAVPMSTRPSLDQIGISAGKKARLYRILHQHGLRNGTAIFLPYDHGLEHGPRDFADDPSSGDPRHIIKLALEGGFNGIAIQIGLA
jgi:fructose-bisphosphate aldolase, class I